MGRVREKRRVQERRSEKRTSQKKEDADARKGRKVAKHCVFPMICGSGGSKSRLAKAAGAEPSGQMRDEKVHAVGTPPVILSTLFNITFQCCLVTLNMQQICQPTCAGFLRKTVLLATGRLYPQHPELFANHPYLCLLGLKSAK